MAFNIDMIQHHYKQLPQKIEKARAIMNHPLTMTEKILYSHLFNETEQFGRGEDYAEFSPDRVAMQDATAQMALLQFMTAGKDKVAVPSTVHADHLIQAKVGAATDLDIAKDVNSEVYNFLSSVSNKYGIGYWKPGAELFTK